MSAKQKQVDLTKFRCSKLKDLLNTCSLQIFGITADLPVDESMQIVEYHVLISLDFLVGLHDTDADACLVDLRLINNNFLSKQVKVILKVVSSQLDVVLGSFLVEQ